MKTTVNKDGSITTSVEDEAPVQPAAESKAAPKDAEAKVVKTPAKAAPKAASTAESK